MKGIHLTMIILGIVSLTSFILGALLIGVGGLDVVMNYDQEKFDESYTINEAFVISDDVQVFVIDSVSTDVIFHYGDEASATLSGGSSAENPPYLDVKEEGDKVFVTVRYPLQSTWFFKGISHLTLDIVVVDDVQVDLNVVSADVFTEDVLFIDSSIESVSGDIFVGYMMGESKLSSVSGDISVKKANGAVDIHSVSGDVSLLDWDIRGTNKIETTSGDVQVFTSSESSYSFVVDSVSGDIVPRNLAINSIDKKHLTGNKNGGDASLTVNTVSGDIIFG